MGPLFRELGSDSSSNNLVEFRAGKMHLRGTTVTADKRKGLVYVHQSDDSLMHFCWKDRTSGVVEDVSSKINSLFYFFSTATDQANKGVAWLDPLK